MPVLFLDNSQKIPIKILGNPINSYIPTTGCCFPRGELRSPPAAEPLTTPWPSAPPNSPRTSRALLGRPAGCWAAPRDWRMKLMKFCGYHRDISQPQGRIIWDEILWVKPPMNFHGYRPTIIEFLTRGNYREM